MEDMKWKAVELTPENLGSYPLGCIKNPKHVGFRGKAEWFKETHDNGMQILILLDQEDKPQGFLEMIPGEHTWRGIDAKSYMVIHCIWIGSKNVQGTGGGAFLLKEAEKRVPDNLEGIASVVGDTSLIATSSLFKLNGYEEVDHKDKYQLYVKRLQNKGKEGKKPAFTRKAITDYKGFHMLYSMQCPMEIKWKDDISKYCHEHGIDLKLHLIENHKMAQENPNPLGTFALIFNNEIIEDHPVSLGRFKNIVKKELKLLE